MLGIPNDPSGQPATHVVRLQRRGVTPEPMSSRQRSVESGLSGNALFLPRYQKPGDNVALSPDAQRALLAPHSPATEPSLGQPAVTGTWQQVQAWQRLQGMQGI